MKGLRAHRDLRASEMNSNDKRLKEIPDSWIGAPILNPGIFFQAN
jgi:hypothetical protein